MFAVIAVVVVVVIVIMALNSMSVPANIPVELRENLQEIHNIQD
jgi:hypothetical protein